MKHTRNGVIGTMLGLACTGFLAFSAAAQMCGSEQASPTEVSLQTIQCNSCRVDKALTLGQMLTLSANGNESLAHEQISCRDAKGLEYVIATKD